MTLQKIKDYLDDYYGLDISEKCREDVYIRARCHYVIASRYATDAKSDRKIGSYVGLNHSTVIHARKTFDSFFASDKVFREEYSEITAHVKKHTTKRYGKVIDKINTLSDNKLKKEVLKLSKKNQQLLDKINNQRKKIKELT